MKTRNLAIVICFILVSAVLAGSAAAQPALTLTPSIGPPTSQTKLSGSGFYPYEAVDVYFDFTDVVLKVTSEEGGLSYDLTVPASAQPGTHWITLVGRSSSAAAQAAFTVRTDWPQFHRKSNHQGRNLLENVLSPGNVPNLTQAWSYSTNHYVDSSPAVAGGNVYAGSWDKRVYALDAATGDKIWVKLLGDAIYSSPAVNGNKVFVGCINSKIYALSVATGAILWHYVTGGPIYSSPAVANGSVYITSTDKKVYSLKATDGTRNWFFLTGGPVVSSPAVAG